MTTLDVTLQGTEVIDVEVTETVIDVELLAAGPQGPAGQGVVAGGSSGQVLRKQSGVDYDTAWATLLKDDVGLGNVDNTSDAGKPVSTATQTALGLKADKSYVDGQDLAEASARTSGDASTATTAQANLSAHTGRTDNPHVVTKAQVGLANVDNTSDVAKNSAAATLTNKAISGSTNTLSAIPETAVTNLTTDLALKAPLASPIFTGHVTVPIPTNGLDAATKAYVDQATGAVGSVAKTIGQAGADIIVPAGGNIGAVLNSAATAALAAGTCATIHVKAGNYVVETPIIIKAYLNIIGDGQGQTIFQAANGLNNDIFIADQFYSQTGHNYTGYDAAVKYAYLADFEIRGNSANQTSSGQSDPAQMYKSLGIYGYKVFVERVMIRDSKEVALYTEFSNNQPSNFEQYETLPSIFQDIDIKSFGKYGFVDRGPHDSYRNRCFASASQYDTPIASWLIQSGPNYSVAGNHYTDCYGNGPSSTANVLVQGYPSINGYMYAEGSPTAAFDVQAAASNFNFQCGYAPIGIIFRGDSGGSLSRNHFTLQLIYTEPPLAYKLVGNMQSNSFHHYNQNQSTASFPAPSSGNGNTVLFDTSSYAGGNNEFYGRVGGSKLFSDETKLTPSDRIDMQSDNYPDYNRRSFWQFPMGGERMRLTNDGFEDGIKLKPSTVKTESDWLETDGVGLYYTNHNGMKVRLNKGNGDILVASNTAPDAWKAQANYVCTGTADDTVINPLIQAAYVGDTGGRIILTPGTFYLAAPLALYLSTSTTTPTVKLIGSGMDATYLRPAAGVHAITVGKATQAWVQDMAFELDGSSDGIHDIDGLTSTDGIGWRMRHSRIENIKWSGLTTHTGWGINIQPFRIIMSNLDGNTGRSGYTYPANGVKLSARVTPNTGATFNAGDSVMQKVQITVNGLAAGQKALWIDTDDSSATNYDASYFNQMVFQWIGLRSNVSGQGTAFQVGHAGANKTRSVMVLGMDFEQFGVGIDLYNAQGCIFETFYTSLVASGGTYFRTDNTGTVNNTVNNWWRSGSTVGVFGVTGNVIQDLNTDTNNLNTYEHLMVETSSGGTAQINGSASSTVPAGVLIKSIGGVQRVATRHPAFSEPLTPISAISGLTAALAGASSGSATHIFVASSSASARVKAIADYVCTGTNDHTPINQALAAGLSVELSDGQFNLGGAIVISRSNVSLQGQGQSTTLFVSNGVNGNGAIQVTGTGTVEVKVRRLTIDGNKANQTFGGGIDVNTPWQTTDTQHLFEDVYIKNCKNNGFNVIASSDTRVIQLNRVHVKNCDGNGFYMPFPSNTDSTFIGCIADTCGLNGFFVGAANDRFIGCKSFYNGITAGNNHGFRIVGYNNYFEACEAQDNYQSGFYGDNTGDTTYGAQACTFINCIADSNNQAANASYGAGMQILNTPNWQIIGGLYFTRPYPSFTQRVGILLQGSTTGTTIVGAQGTGNSSGLYSDTSTGSNTFVNANTGITADVAASASFTAAANTKYTVDATSGTLTATLPTTGSKAQLIFIQKSDATANVLNVTGNINGTAGATLPIRTQLQGKLFQWTGATWDVIAGDLSLPALDARYLAPTGSGAALTGITESQITNLTTDLAATEKTANKNIANGYAGLDGTGKVAAAQLPAYVDDVLEYANLAALPATGSSGIIYVTQDTNFEYRWSGSAYIRLVSSPGTTDALAEGTTNKYYTDARVSANSTVATNSSNIATNTSNISANTSAIATKEPAITAGTSAQYWRGDKTMQTLNQDAVPDGTTNKAYTATEKTKLSGIAAGATANSTDAVLLARANHTGTESADVITDGTTNKAYTATEQAKLAGVAPGATANQTDAKTKAYAIAMSVALG